MPDTSETPETPVETGAAAETPQAQYVSAADFERITRENAERHEAQMAEMRRLVADSLNAARQPAAPAPSGELTDEQLQQAVDEGRMTHAAMVRHITQREQARFAREHIDPLRATGLSSISSMAKTLAQTARREDGSPLYPHSKRYGKEIDAILNEWTKTGAPITTEAYEQAYRYVVGGHIDEIAAETREAAVRSAQPTKPETPAAGRPGRGAGAGPQKPSTEALFGANVFDAVEGRSRTLDQQARAMGYKDWATYEGLAAELERA